MESPEHIVFRTFQCLIITSDSIKADKALSCQGFLGSAGISPEIGGGALEGAFASTEVLVAVSLLPAQPAKPTAIAAASTTFNRDDVMVKIWFLG
jgi:hypothetical protein